MDARLLPDVLVFLEVARSGNMTLAAERLNTVQSNVTARVRKLEAALGARLLTRHARGVKVTPAGEVLVGIAQRLDAAIDDLEGAFGRPEGGGRTAKIRLGAIETVAATELPPLVAEFRQASPNVDVVVQTGSSAALTQQLKSRDLDVVFVSRPVSLAGFRSRLALQDELVVVAPRAVADLSALLNDAGGLLKVLIQRQGCSYTERLLAFIARKSTRRCDLLELGTLEGIVNFVEIGLGVAALPRRFIERQAAGRALRIIEIPDRSRVLGIHLAAAAKPECSAAVNRFVELCETRAPARRK